MAYKIGPWPQPLTWAADDVVQLQASDASSHLNDIDDEKIYKRD